MTDFANNLTKQALLGRNNSGAGSFDAVFGMTVIAPYMPVIAVVANETACAERGYNQLLS